MLTNKTKLYVFVSIQADEQFQDMHQTVKTGYSEDPAGKRCWVKEDFTFSAIYYNVLFEWEGGVQEHNIFMYYL